MNHGHARSGTGGFSLVETLVAMVILAMGVLAMAATTGYVSGRLRVSGFDTERTLAVQTVVEELRALDYANVATRDRSAAQEVHGYRIWWSVEEVASNLKQVLLVSEGPGYASGGPWSAADQDTLIIGIFKP